jgi:DNA polymerase-1
MIKSFPKSCKEVQEWFRTANIPTLVVDCETDGLRWGCSLKGISFCDGKQACYINLENNNDYINILETIKFEIRLCWLSDSLIIGHNLVFDLRVLEQAGIKWDGRIFDTMVAAHLLNENDSCALKELAVRVLKVPREKVLTFKKAVVNGYSSEMFKNYAINDSIWTYQLYEKEKPLIEKDFKKLFYSAEMPFQFVLIDLYKNGIKVDTERLEEIDDVLSARKILLEQEMVESLGMKMIETPTLFGHTEVSSPVNFDSPDQVRKIIEEQLKLKLPYKTKGGKSGKKKSSTGKRSLARLKGKHKFIDLMLEYNSLSSILATFVQPIYELLDSDGRIRTSFNDCGTKTGRLSSSEPNLQNLPKEIDKDTNKIRSLFIAEKGYKLVNKDWSGQELRMLGVVSNDSIMVEAFRRGLDLHLFTANRCFLLSLTNEEFIEGTKQNDLAREKYKKERHIGKNGVNFPIIYGSTARGIAANNNVSEDEAQRWIDTFFSLYPDVKKAIRETKQELIINHYVSTIFGRKRRFTEINDKAIRQAFNFKIQSACADFLRMAMIKVRELYQEHPDWEARMVLTVHDDFSTEVKKEYAEMCGKAEKEIMENIVKLSVGFPVDLKIVDNLGE